MLTASARFIVPVACPACPMVALLSSLLKSTALLAVAEAALLAACAVLAEALATMAAAAAALIIW